MDESSSSPQSKDAAPLPEILDMRAAGALAAHFSALRGDQIVVDASNVKKIGMQCMQVILSARATWENDGLSFALFNPSAEVTAAFAAAGLSVEKLTQREAGK